MTRPIRGAPYDFVCIRNVFIADVNLLATLAANGWVYLRIQNPTPV